MNKTQRLINRIQEKESFSDIAYICEDFETFVFEIFEQTLQNHAKPYCNMDPFRKSCKMFIYHRDFTSVCVNLLIT